MIYHIPAEKSNLKNTTRKKSKKFGITDIARILNTANGNHQVEYAIIPDLLSNAIIIRCSGVKFLIILHIQNLSIVRLAEEKLLGFRRGIEMLIRSQNEETLLNMDRVTTVELGANGLKIVANTDDTVYALGDYSTKDKALNVLDMIKKSCAYEKTIQYTAMAMKKDLDEMDSFSILQVRDSLMEDAVFQMPQDSDVRTRKELLLEKLEQRVRTMITTRTLDSKVVSEKFLYFGDVKSIVEEVMSNE